MTGAGGLNLTPAADYTNNTNAGTATRELHFAGDANHTGAATRDLHHRQGGIDDDGDLPGGPFTYTGVAADARAVTVTGAGGLNLTPSRATPTTSTRHRDGELQLRGRRQPRPEQRQRDLHHRQGGVDDDGDLPGERLPTRASRTTPARCR